MALLSNIPVTNPPSLSFTLIEEFNEQAKITFDLLLETTRETSQEQLFLGQCQQMIEWLMELLK